MTATQDHHSYPGQALRRGGVARLEQDTVPIAPPAALRPPVGEEPTELMGSADPHVAPALAAEVEYQARLRAQFIARRRRRHLANACTATGWLQILGTVVVWLADRSGDWGPLLAALLGLAGGVAVAAAGVHLYRTPPAEESAHPTVARFGRGA